MIKTTAIITEELKNYSAPANKLSRMVKHGDYIPIVKGLYETDRLTPGYLLATAVRRFVFFMGWIAFPRIWIFR